MKKLVILLLVLAIAGVLIFKLVAPKEEKKPEIKDNPLAISKNSDVFNTAFGSMLDEYYSLRDALVEWDTVAADKAAYALALKADSLPLAQLKADSNIVQTAKSFVVSVSSEAKGLVGEGDIVQKRRGFNALTDQLYTLITTVRYDRNVVYHIKCPMAFNDTEEGYWLSDKDSVINPYLGKHHPKYKATMLGCGEVTDSLNFVKK